MLKIEIDRDLSKEFMDLKNNNEIIDDDANILKNSRPKKKKKDKFIDDKFDLLLGDESDDDILTDNDILLMKKPKKGKKDIFDEKEAKKKSKKNIEIKFNPDITSLKKILKDADITAADAKAIFDELKNSRARGVGTLLVNLLQTINTANYNRASIVRQIASIRKDVIDLQFKQDKGKKNKEEESKNIEEYGTNLLASLFSSSIGRRDLKEKAKEYYNTQDFDEYKDEDSTEYINNRLENEESSYRTKEGNKYIEYETYKPEDVILYHSNGEWEVSALDKNGELMPDDYPFLTAENLGKVSFNLDEYKATDEKGRMFRVIEVP